MPVYLFSILFYFLYFAFEKVLVRKKEVENAQTVVEKKYDQPVASVSIKKDADGKPILNDKGQPTAIVTLADGTTKDEIITQNTSFVGSDGNQVTLSKAGVMTPADGKPVPAPPKSDTNPTKVGDGSLIVRFSKYEGQNYGFDGVENGAGVWGRDNLTLGQTQYYVPIKSIEAGKDDYVTFSLQGSGAITFNLEINGTATTLTPEGNRIKLNVPVTGNATLYVKDDQNRVVGKLTILSYPMVTKNVVLVSLNGSSLPDASGLQSELNKVFAQGVARVNVSTMSFATEKYTNSNGINTERNHYKYSADMAIIIDDFKNKSQAYTNDANTVYLFFAKSQQVDLAGVMNRGYQFGFIFDPNVKAIAHELSHGIFRLEHTGDDNSLGKAINDLMDYSPGGDDLYKYQWAQIQNPPSVWSIFENPQGAEYQTDGHYSTIYLIGLMLGLPNAKEIAFWTEYPDYAIHDKTAEVRTTWLDGDHQKLTHALTNGYHSEEEFLTAVAIINSQESDLKELGRLLHRYGDTYAHTILANRMTNPIPINEKRMYGKEIPFVHWTKEHAYADAKKGSGSEPDLIKNDPNWYLRYVKNVSELIAMKFQKDPNKININIFEKLANYAQKNNVSLIGIINYEIAMFKGDKSFTIPYPVVEEGVSAIDYFASGLVTHFIEVPNYETYVSNTINYLNSNAFGILYEVKRASELIISNEYTIIKPKEVVIFIK